MSTTSLQEIITSPYIKDVIDYHLWNAILESHAEDADTYLTKVRPKLEAWAAKLNTPLIWYIDDLSQTNQVQALAPFAIIGCNLVASNIAKLSEVAPHIKALSIANPWQLDAPSIIEALETSELRLEHFTLKHQESTEIIEALVTSSSAQTLQRISITSVDQKKPAKGIEQIATTPLPSLTHLDLKWSLCGLRAAKAIFKSKELPALTHLNLSICKLNAGAIKALADSQAMSTLTHLWLGGNKLGPEGLVPLAYSSHMKSLRSLEVSKCDLQEPSFEALFDSPFIKNLESLDVSSSHQQRLSEMLANAPNMHTLERLNFMWSGGRKQDVIDTLSQAKNLSNLKHLHASEAEEIIAASPHIHHCLAVKTWHFNNLDELPLQESSNQVQEDDQDDTPEGWNEAFGELRALTQEFSSHQAHDLWEWISTTARKFPDLYEHKALPYLTTWANTLPEPPMLDVTSSSLLGPMAELAPFARLHLNAEDVKTADFKSKKAQNVYKISLSTAKSDRIAQGRAKAIGASKHLKNLRHIYSWVNKFGDEGIAAIADNPNLKALEILELRASSVSNAGALAIADSPHMSNLRTLDLEGSSLTAPGIEAIANSPHLTNLTTFIPGTHRGGNEGALAIAASASMKSLRTLELARVSADGISALLESEHLPALESLHLKGITLECIEALAESAGALKLKHLKVEQCRNAPGTVIALASSPNLSNLKSLSLPYAALSPDKITAIANSPHLNNLETLDLSDGVYTDDSQTTLFGQAGLEALVASTHLAHLEELDLSTCGLGPESADLIAASPFFDRIKVLKLHSNRIGSEKYGTLAKSPHLANLDTLVVTNSYQNVPLSQRLLDEFEGAPFTIA